MQILVEDLIEARTLFHSPFTYGLFLARHEYAATARRTAQLHERPCHTAYNSHRKQCPPAHIAEYYAQAYAPALADSDSTGHQAYFFHDGIGVHQPALLPKRHSADGLQRNISIDDGIEAAIAALKEKMEAE